jgi:hypothetical protein
MQRRSRRERNDWSSFWWRMGVLAFVLLFWGGIAFIVHEGISH